MRQQRIVSFPKKEISIESWLEFDSSRSEMTTERVSVERDAVKVRLSYNIQMNAAKIERRAIENVV